MKHNNFQCNVNNFEHNNNAKLYQASSSEMFGNSIDEDGYQRETTPMNPVSPYACSKLFAYNIVKCYRDSYNLKSWNGILFNHESPRRGENFVTNKVVIGAVKIKKGYGSVKVYQLGWDGKETYSEAAPWRPGTA